jgi:hypothetical protein
MRQAHEALGQLVGRHTPGELEPLIFSERIGAASMSMKPSPASMMNSAPETWRKRPDGRRVQAFSQFVFFSVMSLSR